MALITLLSAKGSPGCTTTALGLTLRWPASALLVEADTSGSAVLAGYLQGQLHQDHGVLPLAVAQAHGGRLEMGALWDQTMVLGRLDPPKGQRGRRSAAMTGPVGRSYLLPGIPHATQAGAVRTVWSELAGVLMLLEEGGGVDVIADLGRVGFGPDERHALLSRSDQIVVVTGSALPQIHATQTLAEDLRARYGTAAAEMSPLAMLVVGPGRPFDAGEIAKLCGLRLAGAVAWDPSGAAVYSAGQRPGRKFDKAAFTRSLASLAESLQSSVAARRAHLAGSSRGGGR